MILICNLVNYNSPLKFHFNYVVLFVVEAFSEVISDIGRKSSVTKIVSDKDPQTMSAGLETIMISLYQGRYGVVIPGAHYIPANNLIDALRVAFMLFFVFHIEYDAAQKCIYGIMDKFACVKSKKIHLGNEARLIVTNIM